MSSANTTPTTMIATIIPAIPGIRYMSATVGGSGVGAGVAGGAASTPNAV